jgi:hypothetical protein
MSDCLGREEQGAEDPTIEDVKRVKTICRGCHGGCGVIAHVKDERVIKVEGDPDPPTSHGTMCTKGLSIIQLAYQPASAICGGQPTNSLSSNDTWSNAKSLCQQLKWPNSLPPYMTWVQTEPTYCFFNLLGAFSPPYSGPHLISLNSRVKRTSTRKGVSPV